MSRTIIDDYQDKTSWNDFIQNAQTGHVLQTWEYGEVRKAMGTSVLRIAVTENDKIKTATQMSLHKVPYLPFQIGYVPRGPVCDEEPEKYLQTLFSYFKELAKKYDLAFIKVEPNISLSHPGKELWLQQLVQFGTRSSNPRFMNATSIIDLSKSEEELLANCRKNTRYAIRKAEKEGIQFVEVNNAAEGIDLFYGLLSQTAQRQGFQLASRPKKYFELLWEQFYESGKDVRLFFALINDEPVATIFNLYSGTTAYYPYGASSTKAHGTSATEGLMWHSIMAAKSAGMTKHDLWGVLAKEDKEHPYWGYTFFKNGFGGELVEYIGSYDLPFTPLYHPLQWAEKARRWLLKH